MTTKTYQARVSIHLSMDVEIDGFKREINFTGGKNYPVTKFGTFSTSDVKLQAAIEKNNGFKKDFILLKKTAAEDKEPLKSEIKEVKGVTTVSAMKAYLNKEEGVSFSEMSNLEAINEICKTKKISFPDYKEK